MLTKIFIAFRHLSHLEEGIKKVSFEGKEYYGVFAHHETISLNEIKTIAESHGQDPSHVTLLPLLLFG